MKKKVIITQGEALEKSFELLKPSLIGKTDYDKLYTYKRRYEKGELGQNGIETLLSYFGFKKEIGWYKDGSSDDVTPS